MADISNIRTLEDLTNVVAQLYFNLNKLDALYYDMFINPIPMTLELERYDESGKLTTVTLNNRAKDIQGALTGAGKPDGAQTARPGTFYIDTETRTLYYKSTGTDAYGWVAILSVQNFVEGTNYLSPSGNGSQLTSLNASQVSSGLLSVMRGGTGTSGLEGLIKANGSSPFSAAVDGVDYLGPSGSTGIICYYPTNIIPVGWLRCDGAAYSRTTYARLFSKIGTMYGEGDGSTTFNVPDLMDMFIRGWDGSRAFNTVQEDQVGTHTHPLTGTTGAGSPHSHTRGDMNITGSFRVAFPSSWGNPDATGAFSHTYSGSGADAETNNGFRIDLDASNSWTGSTSSENTHTHALSGNTAENAENQETRVINKALVPIIKY